MRFLSLSSLIIISIASISIGLLLCLNPTLAFKIQKKFYEKINWRIEPISTEKETRNTKIMGLFLIIVTVLILTYGLMRG